MFVREEHSSRQGDGIYQSRGEFTVKLMKFKCRDLSFAQAPSEGHKEIYVVSAQPDVSLKFAKVRYNGIHLPKEGPHNQFRPTHRLGLLCQGGRGKLAAGGILIVTENIVTVVKMEAWLPVNFLGCFWFLFKKHNFPGSQFSYRDFPFCFYIFFANEVTGDI